MSASAIDDNNTLCYGHPFAKTSYPLIKVGSKWSKPGEATGATLKSLTQTPVSLAVEYSLAGGLSYRFSMELDSQNQGSVSILSEFTNSSASVLMAQSGLVLDPGLGWTGQDAWAVADGISVTREQVANPAGIELWERAVGHNGVGFSLAFGANSTEETQFGNWQKIASNDGMDFDQNQKDLIYDLTLKTIFKPLSVPAGGKASTLVRAKLSVPDFGSAAFLRWDCPRFLSTTGGTIYPQDIPTTLRIFNPGAIAASLSARAELPYQIVTDTPLTSFSAPPGQWSFTTRTLHFRENYQGNSILTVKAQAMQGQSVVDSLSFLVFQPVSPYTNQGLTVLMDSIFTLPDGTAHLLFNTRQTQTGQPVFNLGIENLVLKENGKIINDFSVDKDTTGGASQLDIVFILDVTGSMGEEIAGVKNNIMQFGDNLTKQGVDFQLGMVTFLDEVETIYPMTSDIQEFKNKVGAQYAHGGGDGPENSLDALNKGSSMQFRSKSKVLFIWITDAEYHQSDAVTSSTAPKVLQTLLEKDIQVFCIGTPSLEGQYYSPIYQPTGGRFYDINGNFQDILLDIAGTRYSRNLMLTYKPSGGIPSGQLVLEVHANGLGGLDTLSLGGVPVPKTAASQSSLRIACEGLPCSLAGALGSDAIGILDLFDMRGSHLGSVDLGGTGSRARELSHLPNHGLSASGPGLFLFTFKDRNPSHGRSMKQGQILFINKN
ncbi:MAG: vWA domain-containing protein [Fibrobacteria bacterium]